MARVEDKVLMDPQRIRQLLIAAYAEGRRHENTAHTDRYGSAPQFEESLTKVWADLYNTVEKV